ncbi:adenylate/guanylate cyclase domain-containing protein [Nocardioides sp.]|uniref:adenylate/guanylate cyclase domain-containing protein n=1 Tax=Nocardioides sp. TaxID=35761 RepID=UPI00286B294D|nr:adenylate/guanylate cyclase domain-containing protein [Nocardioides sp.]
MTALAVVLAVAVLALGATLAVARQRLSAARAELVAEQERSAQLEADLDAALRPRPAATATERAVRRVVETASRVRDHGIAGLLERSLEDLASWAADERTEIVNLAASDGTVTLLFSDIEGSTSLNHRLGDAAWVKLLAAHDQLVRSRVDRYRGQVVKTAGDGFMVAFRDAEAACRAALGIQKDLGRSLDARLRPVRVRIGIHTGTVVSRDGDYFGRNVAMAARVADKAVGGEVLASGAVLGALDDDAAVTLVKAADVELRGLPGRHDLYRVERRRASL